MTYHSTAPAPGFAASLARQTSMMPVSMRPEMRRPRPGGTLKKPPPPPAPSPTSDLRTLWRFEIWTNPTGPKGGSKLVYYQVPAYFTASELAPVIAMHKKTGTHARIWRQRRPDEASAGTWQQVNDPPGSVYDLEPLSGLGVTIAAPQAGGQMLLPPCVPQEVKVWAQSQCQVPSPHGYDTLGQLMMPLQLNPQTFDWTKAPVCAVAQLPVCAPPAGGGQPGQPDTDEDGGEGDETESAGLIIGGIILLAVIGGGYVYYKSRKK